MIGRGITTVAPYFAARHVQNVQHSLTALIVASAEQAGASQLYTEDLNAGQIADPDTLLALAQRGIAELVGHQKRALGL